ncbi:MAG TPA: nucleoside hydrolase [Cellvibrio sp.]|nr:nucleoside hydrolase [Cellvibrio sp.]
MNKILLAVGLLGASIVAHAKPIIFDNDMAIDDWAALLYLLHHPDADVIAVTIAASGESRCKPGLANTNSLLDLPGDVKKDIPVACGDAYPLDGYFVFPEPWRKDSDTLSGVPIKSSSRIASDKHAADIIHSALTGTKEPVTLIATGPLTNIAQWLKRYPTDKHKIDQLVIMGGAVDVPGNIIVPLFTKGHPNTTAEWNIFVDPVAADTVFSAGLPIVLVGLDITNSVRVTTKVATDFKQAAKTNSAKFWDSVLDNNDWFIASNEYYFWDTLAVMIAVEPSLCQGDMQSLRVDYQTTSTPWQQTTDNTMPATRWDGKKRNHLNAKTAGTLFKDKSYPTIKVCRKTNPEQIFNTFREVLNSK